VIIEGDLISGGEFIAHRAMAMNSPLKPPTAAPPLRGAAKVLSQGGHSHITLLGVRGPP